MLRRAFFGKISMLGAGGFNPFGSWEDFSLIANRSGYAWKNIIGQSGKEFGAWTPALTINGSATGITYALRTGFFTKFSRAVTVYCHVILANKGATAGQVQIEGLPFNIPTSDFAGGTGAVYFGGMTASLVNLIAKVSGNPPLVTLYRLTAADTDFFPLQDTDISNATEFQFSLTYYTTA